MVQSPLTEPFLIVCEGTSDEAFLRHLIDARGIGGFQYAYPEEVKDEEGNRIGGAYGREGFGDLLGGLTTRRGFPDLRAIVLITDSDNSPRDALRFAQRKIHEAGGFDRPTDLLKPSRRLPDRPPIVVVTLPWIDELGNLETLILKAAPDHFPDEWRCLEEYFGCTPAPRTWSVGKQSKMRLASLVAAACKADPTCTTTLIWSEDKTTIFRPMLGHTAFNPLVDLLRSLPNLLRVSDQGASSQNEGSTPNS